MNYKYAYVKDGVVIEIRPTMTLIPKGMWVKKGLLPYEENYVDIPDTEVLPDNSFEILANKVIETKYIHVHVDTLDESKENKISNLKNNTLNYTYQIYPQWKRDQVFAQQNGYDWGYTDQQIIDINNWLLEHKTQLDVIEQDILNCTTKTDIDLLPDVVELPKVL